MVPGLAEGFSLQPLLNLSKVSVSVHVLCCFALFACLTLLASFFLPSHLSLKHVHVHVDLVHTLQIVELRIRPKVFH